MEIQHHRSGFFAGTGADSGALPRSDAKAGKAPCGEPFAVDHERMSHASTFFDASRDGASACAVLASPSVAAGQDSSPLEKLRSKLVQSR
ncbi:hypothetical protein, partial [Xanthomonas phaseoli]|uniref:hypothetical protein n=1 Tax=Xanthomonas phaseoli TaxID=1985254 RepID=UPI001C559105